jgi:hypothetical protein
MPRKQKKSLRTRLTERIPPPTVKQELANQAQLIATLRQQRDSALRELTDRANTEGYVRRANDLISALLSTVQAAEEELRRQRKRRH